MTLPAFWNSTDTAQATACVTIRADARIDSVYAHALVLESWRQHLLAAQLREGLPFWYEAQNDYLLSLVHAGGGIWRSSLQALRSFLENSTGALYYSDHPVEARRFATGEFRLTWVETKQYLATYPYPAAADAYRGVVLDSIAHEYSELSKAVHGSAESFRMTAAQQFPTLFSSERTKIGAWRTRAIACARAVNSLLLLHFASDLAGARLRPLREDIGTVFTARERTRIRSALGVVIPTV